MTPLPGEHEDQVNEIVTREVERFGRLVMAEIASFPMRADGALNAIDAYKAVEAATIRFAENR